MRGVKELRHRRPRRLPKFTVSLNFAIVGVYRGKGRSGSVALLLISVRVLLIPTTVIATEISDRLYNQTPIHTHRSSPTLTMASALTIGLGLLGAGLGGRALMQILRAGKSSEAFLKGGFKAKMDKSEALQILGLK